MRRDLLVRATRGDLAQHVELARADAERGLRFRVAVEDRFRGATDHARTDVDTEDEKRERDQKGVDVARMGPRQALVVEPLQAERPCGQKCAVCGCPFPHRPCPPLITSVGAFAGMRVRLKTALSPKTLLDRAGGVNS
jgi:hypothetical protein